MTAALEARGLVRRFEGLIAVNDVELVVGPGQIVGLIGPNGAGKTTVFNLLAGFLTPDAGDVMLHGRSVTGLQPWRICRLGLSRTFQIPKPLVGLTLLDNVTIGALNVEGREAAARRRALAIIERVGLAGRAGALAGTLNGPERKRLEVARALATRPSVLLLDEIASGVTPAESLRLMDVVRGIRDDGVSIVLIEHVMRAVMAVSDHVVVMHHGEVIASGPPRQIVADPRVIEAYLGADYDRAAED